MRKFLYSFILIFTSLALLFSSSFFVPYAYASTVQEVDVRSS